MLEALQLSTGHRVLEIGAGTGYNAALLKYLVGDEGRVTSIDIESSFASRARRALAQAGYSCRIIAGDGRDGWLRNAPYDRIMVTAASDAVWQAWRDQLIEGGLIELPFRFTRGLLPQLVVTLRREGDMLRSVAVLSGTFMALRDKDGANSPIDNDPALRVVTGERGNLAVVASLQGQMLSKLSASARQRALALLLGRSRRLRSVPPDSGLGLVTFLQLCGISNLANCNLDRRFGVAILGPDGSSIVTVTRAPGQPAWVEAWGGEETERLFAEHVQRWEQLGRPDLSDLRLTISYGSSVPSRAWRTLRLADSAVSIDWVS